MSTALMLNHGITDLHKRSDIQEGQLMRLPLAFLERNKMRKIDLFERWLDRYNHIMELFRTIIPIITLILQIFIIVNLLN